MSELGSAKLSRLGLSETKIDSNTLGDKALIAATSGKQGRLYKLVLNVTADVTITFKDGATDLTGAMAIAAKGGLILDLSSEAWFTTSVNSALNMNVATNVQVSGRAYWRVD